MLPTQLRPLVALTEDCQVADGHGSSLGPCFWGLIYHGPRRWWLYTFILPPALSLQRDALRSPFSPKNHCGVSLYFLEIESVAGIWNERNGFIRMDENVLGARFYRTFTYEMLTVTRCVNIFWVSNNRSFSEILEHRVVCYTVAYTHVNKGPSYSLVCCCKCFR